VLNISCLPGGCVQGLHLLVVFMQPHPPQLPTDAPTSPAPKNLKKGALLLFIVVAIVAAVIAFVLPEKQVEANQTSTQQGTSGHMQQVQSDAYKSPTGK
jgi:hypothetical protein